MEKYLVVIRDVDDTDAVLRDKEKLTRFLHDNLLEEFYSSHGFTIEAIYRFDGSDHLTLLDLACTSVVLPAGDSDFIHYLYRVTEPGGNVVATFEVTIDGRV